MDEMADEEVHPMLTIYSERHLSLLWIRDQNTSPSKVFARRQVRKVPSERLGAIFARLVYN